MRSGSEASDPDRRGVTLAEELNPPRDDPDYQRRSAADMARRTAEWERRYQPPELVDLDRMVDPRQDPTFEYDPVLSPPVPLHVADLTEPPAGADDWLFQEFMRPGTLNALVASQGVGKSFLRDEIAMRAVTGAGDLFGVYPTCRQANVLIIDEDMGHIEEWNREEAMLRHLDLRRSDLQGYYRVSFGGVRLDDPNWCHWLDQIIGRLKIGLLILDPISELYAVKELREELLPIKNRLRDLIRHHPDLTVLLVHHLKKAGPNAKQSDRNLDDVRGAVWGQAADVIALVSPLGDRRVRWELHKRVRPSALILEQTSNGPFVCIADGDTKEQEASKDQRVMDAIDGGCERIDAVTAVTGLPKRTAWNAIRRLRQAGILEPRGDFRRRSDTT